MYYPLHTEDEIKDKELDEAHLKLVRLELNKDLREVVREWAREHKNERMFYAAYSATSARWGDITKDIQRGYLTIVEVKELLDKCLECSVLVKRTYEWFNENSEKVYNEFITEGKSKC